ncbi:Metalloenzyme, LuxS/M16 peptidase-like protein [Mycena rosella]|uniref:Metalloenzyme, LuxS/M16 peptidase-like protein n=1 Tax=Mycena rosella TaxID=1033263 RepID=A0AAD7H0X2_MYCRO|nr:Metalloenzyme, LuxS/M16 peptidase-like protein [Mycena rosella]
MATISDWERVTPTSAPPFSVFTKSLQKSPQDDREYRVIRLENGLEAMLVHDAKADKAAASLDVAVGHLDDPDDMPGLAHFCEHLLFMGTEEFPRENEYSEFLAKNNGGSNAYTSTSNTNYHFNVATSALPQALARFAGFFHSPLFAPSCTSRELNAVDSEHKKNHQADMWRIFQLSKHLSVEGHPWRKFGSGNRESLSQAAKTLKAKGRLETQNGGFLAPSPIPSRLSSPAPSVSSVDSTETEADGGAVGRETRRRLLEWWSKEYCASRMRLCVLGNESLDELAVLASTLFSPILNHGADPLPMVTASPIGPDERGTLVAVQTIMTFHALEMTFPIEWQPPFWRHKPTHFLSHFVGHEGPGSVHSYLKNKGWITGLSCGPQNLARGLSTFKVTAYLTIDGFQNHRQISLAIFKFLTLLRESEFEAFHQRELVTLSATKFRFKEKGRPDSYATWVAEHLARPVPLELVLSAQALTWDWDGDEQPGGGGEAKVRAYLDAFRVENARVTLMAKGAEHAKLAPNAVWKKEPWYGTEYYVEEFDDAFVRQAQGPNDIKELYLPGPNEFIPTNVEVDKRDVAEPLKRPHLIRETPMSTLWHKKDDKFWVPKAHAIIDLRSPFGNESPRAAILTRMYSDVVNDALTEFAYDASLGMLEYNFVPHSNGLYVAMNGFNDKMSVLVKHVLEKIKGIVINPDRLAVMKEQAKRDLENFFLGQSYALSDYYGRYIMAQQQWTIEKLLEELPSVTAEELQRHVKLILSEVHMRMLVCGNLYKDEAVKIAEMAEEGLGASKVPLSQLNDHALVLPRASNHTWTSIIPNPNQANSALTYYVHFGSIVNQHLRVTSSLLTQILQEPAFNILRTKEQLGYIVSCSGWLLAGQSEKGLRIVVQSEKTPGYLEDRVEAFLEGMKTTIEEMSAEDFAEHKGGLKKRWTEAEKNLTEEASRFAVHVTNGQWDFLRNEKDAEFLEGVTKEDVLSMFLSDLHPASKTRAKLSVHMRSQKSRQPRVSSTAAEAFAALVREKGVDGVTETAWNDAPSGDEQPPLPDFKKYWSGVLGGKEGGQDLLDAIPGLVAKHPIPGEGEDAPRPGVTYITDVEAFRKGLTVSVDPGPMVQWGDLPVSKF